MNRLSPVPFLARTAARHRWLHAPVGLLVLLLQRSPALRLGDQLCSLAETCSPTVLRSVFGFAALGAFDSVAGASGSSPAPTPGTGTGTTPTPTPSTLNFVVTDATPASGPAGTAFTISENLGASVNIGITLTGGVTNPKSWSVTGTLPTGLSVAGSNPINVGAPYKLVVAGIPTVTGVWTVTVTAYTGADGTGTFNSVPCTFVIAQNAVIAPIFATQPADAIGVVGGSVTFTAAANGSPEPTYSWYHGAQPLAGQSTSTLTLTNLQAADAGTYTLSAANAAGRVTSSPATLTVNASAVAPTITGQPQSVTVTQYDSATFAAPATGTVSLSYQWYKNSTAIAGAIGRIYAIAVAQLSDAGNYTVTVTNSAGSATSAVATLTVNALQVAPTIATQPQNVTVTEGSAATFTVTATGTAPLSYQWSKDGTAIAGATASSYTIAVVHAADAGNYTVAVANSNGTITSLPAALATNTAQVAPALLTQPQSMSATPGASVTFAVTASGNSPLTYQWLLNGTALAGATAATYTDGNVQPADAGQYTVVVTNGVGSATSQAATLTVSSTAAAATAPAFIVQPNGDTVAPGHTVSFSAATSGNPAVGYQWQLSTDSGSTWSALADNSTYSGTSSATLTIGGVTGAMNGYRYRLVASNAAGSTITSTLTLAVAAPAFPGPYGLAVDSAGNLFVSDSSTNTVQFVTPGGAVSLLAGATGQQGSSDGTYASALFRQPRAVALDKAENAYVADSGNSVIRKITPSGVVTTLAGSTANQGYVDGTGTAAVFNSPQALAVDGSGNVFVADTANSTIRKISPAGVVTSLAGNGTSGSTDGANALALFNQPAGLAVDGAGNLFVADTFNDTIRKVTPAGVVTTLAGVPGVGGYADGAGATALFNHPTGLALDPNGNLYVADTGNQMIRVIAANGTVRSLAGLPTIAGLLDGTGTDAWFNQPESIGLDGSGNLFVADFGNAAIRKVTAAGVVTTVALQTTTSTPAVPAPASSSTSGSSSAGSSSGSGSSSGASSGGGGAIEPRVLLALLVATGVHYRRQRRTAP